MQCKASDVATEVTANSCSSKSLPLFSKVIASSESFAVSSRRIVPANTLDKTASPLRRISNSGVAPINPSTANDQHSGYELLNFVNTYRGSITSSA